MWPFEVLEGIFENILNFGEIKPFEAQAEFKGGSLILSYASCLPTDTLPLRMLRGAPSENFLWETASIWPLRISISKVPAQDLCNLKAVELIGKIHKTRSNSQALYMQLTGMTDELASARYAQIYQ